MCGFENPLVRPLSECGVDGVHLDAAERKKLASGVKKSVLSILGGKQL